MVDFLNWSVIGVGNERTCYQSPLDPKRCIKVSKKERSKQSKRELSYFNYLKEKSIPFTHVPEFYKKVITNEYIGIEQEVIRDSNGCISKGLFEHIKNHCNSEDMKDKLISCLSELHDYLLIYNIIPSDLGGWNILIQVNGNIWKAYLIDGFGSTNVIPLSNYISFFGNKKIDRKWERFIRIKIKPLLENI